jgi:hypothetical protein
MDKCKLCGADIVWGRARTSLRWLALDAIAVNNGVRFVTDDNGISHTTTIGRGNALHTDNCVAKRAKDAGQGELDV